MSYVSKCNRFNDLYEFMGSDEAPWEALLMNRKYPTPPVVEYFVFYVASTSGTAHALNLQVDFNGFRAHKPNTFNS